MYLFMYSLYIQTRIICVLTRVVSLHLHKAIYCNVINNSVCNKVVDGVATFRWFTFVIISQFNCLASIYDHTKDEENIS